MAESDGAGGREGDKASRQAARELIATYHQAELRKLLEHVRTGFDQLDAGTIDEFELDDLIHHYKRAANELWKFCGSSGGRRARLVDDRRPPTHEIMTPSADRQPMRAVVPRSPPTQRPQPRPTT